jgi:hypothetical protein
MFLDPIDWVPSVRSIINDPKRIYKSKWLIQQYSAKCTKAKCLVIPTDNTVLSSKWTKFL